MAKLHINRRYLLDRARHHGGRVLDFGAGAGEFVVAARLEGVDAYGADPYPEGMGTYLREAENTGLLGSYLRKMEGGKLPFPDRYFDMCVSNQVFEHVPNIDESLAEIARVLKPGGILVAIFPSRNVIREGHIGIAFSHWFPTGSRFQYAYILALRSLGFGRLTRGRSRREWVQRSVWRLEHTIVYRNRRELVSIFSRYFDWSTDEPDYVHFRMSAHPRLRAFAWLAQTPIIRSVGAELLRRGMGLIVVAYSKDSEADASIQQS